MNYKNEGIKIKKCSYPMMGLWPYKGGTGLCAAGLER